jgi:hypothetical protein
VEGRRTWYVDDADEYDEEDEELLESFDLLVSNMPERVDVNEDVNDVLHADAAAAAIKEALKALYGSVLLMTLPRLLNASPLLLLCCCRFMCLRLCSDRDLELESSMQYLSALPCMSASVVGRRVEDDGFTEIDDDAMELMLLLITPSDSGASFPRLGT